MSTLPSPGKISADADGSRYSCS